MKDPEGLENSLNSDKEEGRKRKRPLRKREKPRGLAEELIKKIKAAREEKNMEIKKVEFPEMGEEKTGGRLEQRFLGNIPVKVTVELGRTDLTLKEILELAEGSILELDRLAGEPLDLKVGDQLIAQGEVIAVDDYYGLRITNVVIK